MQEDYQELPDYFGRFSEIKAAYLFGSHAAGRTNSLSDLDIAVLLDDDIDFADIKLEILGGLIELGYDNVDLAVLNGMSLLGRYEVVKHQKLLYQREDFDPHSYFSLITRKYLDFKPYLKVQREYLKERVLYG